MKAESAATLYYPKLQKNIRRPKVIETFTDTTSLPYHLVKEKYALAQDLLFEDNKDDYPLKFDQYGATHLYIISYLLGKFWM